jgi:hypothetical protein
MFPGVTCVTENLSLSLQIYLCYQLFCLASSVNSCSCRQYISVCLVAGDSLPSRAAGSVPGRHDRQPVLFEGSTNHGMTISLSSGVDKNSGV